MDRSKYNEKRIFRSIDIIEQNIQKKMTVERIAQSVHFSKCHYQRLFREVVGDSVMRYVTKRRLSLAAGELAETDSTVLEIALKYGFDSHEGFTRSFRAYMGVTPTEYRKYHMSITLPQIKKEGPAMLYSKTTDEIVRELNNLIVQSKETAADTRKYMETMPEAAEFYQQFGNCIAAKADAIADELTKALNRISSITQRPDEISARFVIMKAIEDAAFQAYIATFQTRLTITRAKPEYRAAFEPICGKYDTLAQNAQISADRIADFFDELSSLIFRDMREQAKEKLQKAVEQGRAVVDRLLNDSSLPYAYIADGVKAIVYELSLMPLEEVTVSILEDYAFRLDVIASAADMDALRMPSHKTLFDGIANFKEQIGEAAVFFQSLCEDVAQTPAESEKRSADGLALQGNLLLFYLKGEIQKMSSLLNQSQQTAFNAVCEKMDRAVRRASHEADPTTVEEIAQEFHDVYEKLTEEAGKLSIYGAPVQFIAEEIKRAAG